MSSPALFNDSKTFVDMPLRRDPAYVLAAFKALPSPAPTAALAAFVDANFAAAGSDLEEWTPPDFNPDPPFLDNIANAARQGSGLNPLYYEAFSAVSLFRADAVGCNFELIFNCAEGVRERRLVTPAQEPEVRCTAAT